MSTEIFTGRVKWFNNKTGYGFITVTDGKRSGSDIFVHHSAINIEGQYKYLVQGEYVEFSIIDTASGKHDCQAGTVNGIKGGKLMCSTRYESNTARSTYRKVSTVEETTLKPREEAPREEAQEDGEWTRVESTTSAVVSNKKPRGRPAKPKQ